MHFINYNIGSWEMLRRQRWGGRDCGKVMGRSREKGGWLRMGIFDLC
jgi:hypothetical protein